MNCIYIEKILYNYIFVSNILIHFPPNYVDRLYIGVCDWGLVSYTIEDTPSMQGCLRAHPPALPGRPSHLLNKEIFKYIWVYSKYF